MAYVQIDRDSIEGALERPIGAWLGRVADSAIDHAVFLSSGTGEAGPGRAKLVNIRTGVLVRSHGAEVGRFDTRGGPRSYRLTLRLHNSAPYAGYVYVKDRPWLLVAIQRAVAGATGSLFRSGPESGQRFGAAADLFGDDPSRRALAGLGPQVSTRIDQAPFSGPGTLFQ